MKTFKKLATLLGVLFLFIGIHSSIFAQDSKVLEAKTACENQDYLRSLQLLSIAFDAPQILSKDKLAMAYFYRAKVRMEMLNQAVAENNIKAIIDNRDAYILAYQDLKTLLRLQLKEWDSKAEKELNVLYVGLLQGAKQFLYSYSYEQSIGEDRRNLLLDEAQKYLSAAIDIAPQKFFAKDLYGQVLLAKRDSLGSLAFTQKAIQDFQTEKPVAPDLLVLYMYYREAMLLRYAKNDFDKAILALSSGLKQLEESYASSQKYLMSKPSEDSLVLTRLTAQYQKIKQDFESYRLELYLNTPEKLTEALVVFKEAVQSNPDNYLLHIAYAQLLESAQQADKSIQVYEKAIALNPNAFIAYYNLGALYMNRGLDFQIKAESSKEEAWALKAKESMQLALNPLKKALSIDPNNLETIEALIQISGRLGLVEQYQEYRSQKKKIQGQ